MKKTPTLKLLLPIGVIIGLLLAAGLAAVFRPAIEETVTGKTDLSVISEQKIKELEKQAGAEEQAAAIASVPTGPGYAQPLPESALRVSKPKN